MNKTPPLYPSYPEKPTTPASKSLDTFFELAEKTVIADDFLANREQPPLASDILEDSN